MRIWLAIAKADAPEWHTLITQLTALGQVTILTPGDRDEASQPDGGLRDVRFATRRGSLDGRAAGQLEQDPAFPYNIMAPELALSYELADAAAALAGREGLPDLIVCAASGALPYFLLQRRLTGMHPLDPVPLAVVADRLLMLDPHPHRQSFFRLPRYWVARLERFCMLGADTILTMDGAPCDALAAAIPHLETPCAPVEMAADALAALVRSFRPRTSFPANTPEAQGAALPPSPDSARGLLSVVVPFYNLGAYVGEALDSLAASTYRPIEVLVIDDGSAPDERAALDAAAARHPDLVRVIGQPNAGLARARNAGAAAARGEFVAFLDADDMVDPTYLALSIAVLQRYANVSFVSAWVRLFGAVEACVPTWNPELPFLLGRNMMLEQVVLRRADFLAYGGNDPAIAYAFEDHETWVRMLGRGCVGVNLPATLASYRIRDDSMLRGTDAEVQRYLMELIAARHPQLYERYGLDLFALQNANGAALRWNHPGAETPDDRERLRAAEAAYQQLRARLAPLDPIVQLAQRVSRRK